MYMKRFRKVIRAVILTLLLLAVVLPAALYIVLATPWASDMMRREASAGLTDLLGTSVEIGDVRYRPFSTLSIAGVRVRDERGKAALEVAAVSARFELWHFLRSKRLMFDYVVLDGPQVHLYRDSVGAPLNIDPIIARLQPKDKSKPPTKFDLKINTVVINSGHFTYDVLSAPRRSGQFDASHLSVDGLNLHAYLRDLTENSGDIELESLALSEHSGLRIEDLALRAKYSPSHIELCNFNLRMPGTELSLKPISADIDGYASLPSLLRDGKLELSTRAPATVSLPDFAAFVPALREFDRTLRMSLSSQVSMSAVTVRNLQITDGAGLAVWVQGDVSRIDSPADLTFDLSDFDIVVPGHDAAVILEPYSRPAAAIAGRCGTVSLSGRAAGTPHHIDAELGATLADGRMDIDVTADFNEHYENADFELSAAVTDLDISRLLDRPELGRVDLSATASGGKRGKRLSLDTDARIARFDFRNHSYADVGIDGEYDDGTFTVNVESADSLASLSATASGQLLRGYFDVALASQIRHFEPYALNLTSAREGYVISGALQANATGHEPDDISGAIMVSDFIFGSPSADSLAIKKFEITADRATHPELVTISSDFLNGSIEGRITPSTFMPTLRDMASHILPALLGRDEDAQQAVIPLGKENDFTLDLRLSNAENLSHFFHLPVQVIYPIDIAGNVSSTAGSAYITLDAPYLQQNDKIITSTVLTASIDTTDDICSVYATTHMPTKKGPMTLVTDIKGAENRFDTQIDWVIDRKIPLNGQLNFSTLVGRGDGGTLCADTHFNPGAINFGDDVWNISPSRVNWCDGRLTFDGFGLKTDSGQSISIDGVAGRQADDLLSVALADIRLASIFETLEIDKALIGGTATGEFSARQILSSNPILETPGLHVKDIAYNYCTLGDADVAAHWDNDRQSFFLDAKIINPDGQPSRIWGDIMPASEALDLNFDAHHIKVGFMRPFMEAFADDVDGFVSGKARLFGTFKYIDMEGDVYAEDLKLKIGFTNTWYTATDSIHIRPGRINLDGITIKDVEGHPAKLNGYLTHYYFHDPVFDFRITDARNFLSYAVTPKLNPDWYGTVYGNGSAQIAGRPGVVDINVNMSTAPGSTFTFVLSDRLEAEQYSFITFRDRTEIVGSDTLGYIARHPEDEIPAAVREYQARMQALAAQQDAPSDYRMDIQVDITPDAQMIIVMDPVGGDRIKANGAGDLRMTYMSADNDLRMYGTYTLERGSYNFTLQDIIIKDFTINRGSSITFRGDPYSAQLDIEAVYAVNANLSDLDESFLQDKDLNRTNVPVHALLKVTGDMRQPDIAFDLDFPTLTSDTYRKVRSIISTDEMMNRQIIYLLALNRFYTPDYMASTTKGNELFSVASSTIAGQLSSMLGKLSENWSIAPNLRSDRGDFSDFELDVALSSRLLNNRLLFNGNFGYRDNTLNSNQFIGDFDIEYLLNPRGTWRLKAYNRYNDQNYYVRTATTTQGVGIMFRRDFDSLFPRRKKSAPQDSVAGDSSDKPE